MIRIMDSFIRIPRFELDLYFKLAGSNENTFISRIKDSEFTEFRSILEKHSPYLNRLIDQNKLNRSHQVTILNYLMRCTTRFAPYKDMSTITSLKLGEETNFLNNQKISCTELKKKNIFNEYFIIKNPLIKIIDDYIYIKSTNSIKTIKNSNLVKLIKIKNNHKIYTNTNSTFEKMLIDNHLFLKIKKYDFYNELNDNYTRTSINTKLSNKGVSRKYLEKISSSLEKLTRVLDGTEVNKSIHWIEKIRLDMFRSTGPIPQKLMDIIFTNDLFNQSTDVLLNEVMNKITPIRDYTSKIVLSALSTGEQAIELTDNHLKDLERIKTSRETDLDKEYCVIGTITKNNKFFLNYCRSSFQGIRPISDVVKHFDLDHSSLEYIFVDIICTTKDKEVLQKRPITTLYYISLDQISYSPDMIKIDLEDLYIYPSHKDLVLFSKSLNKRIIPVITTPYLAENDSNSLYRFFASLSKNHFNKGIHLDLSWSNFSFIPRITYNEVILYPRTWRFNKKDINKVKINLPKYVRLIEGDKNGLLIKDSEFFNDQIMKAKSEIVTVTEDFSTNNPIVLSNNKKQLNELVFRYETGERINSLPFKIYHDKEKDNSKEIIELNIYIPEIYIDVTIEYLFKTYFKHIKFYFINYQIPESHIRIRVNKKNKKTVDRIKLDKKISSYRILEIPYKYEISTYNGYKGTELYIEASQILSSKYLKIKNLTTTKSIQYLSGVGPIYEVIYMTFLAEFLLKYSHEEKGVIPFKNKPSYRYEKNIYELIIKEKDTELLLSLKDIARQTCLEIKDIVQRWKEYAKTTNFDRDEYFFEQRLIHMEIFRLTTGKYDDTNTMILRLLNRIKKRNIFK